MQNVKHSTQDETMHPLPEFDHVQTLFVKKIFIKLSQLLLRFFFTIKSASGIARQALLSGCVNTTDFNFVKSKLKKRGKLSWTQLNLK